MPTRQEVLDVFNLSYDRSVETGSWLDLLASAVEIVSLNDNNELVLPGGLRTGGSIFIRGGNTIIQFHFWLFCTD